MTQDYRLLGKRITNIRRGHSFKGAPFIEFCLNDGTVLSMFGSVNHFDACGSDYTFQEGKTIGLFPFLTRWQVFKLLPTIVWQRLKNHA